HMMQRAARPRRLRLCYQRDAHAEMRAVTERRPERINERPDQQPDILDTEPPAMPDHMRDERLPADLEQRLRRMSGQCAEPRSLAACEDDRLPHGASAKPFGYVG